MSVCFFVAADGTATAAGSSEEVETDCIKEDTLQVENIHMTLQSFWSKVNEDVKKVTADDFKTQVLPLARIKKIMKLDEEVKMISAEAPVLFAKAAEIFIHELTLRAWAHTEDNKRRTLQRNDIAMAISKSDQFDFLIDIVPRNEVKVSKPRDDPPHKSSPSVEQVTHQTTTVSSNSQPQYVVQQPAQLVQQQTSNAATTSSGAQPVTLVQQQVCSDLQQLPILLSQAQMNLIRLQVQNNPNQPILIQTQSPNSPQIIQVSSQAPHQPHQVYLAQVSSEDS